VRQHTCSLLCRARYYSYSKSVCLSHAGTVSCDKKTLATIMGSSLADRPIWLVSSWLTLPRNSKANIRGVNAVREG